MEIELQESLDQLRAEIEKYDINLAILRNNQHNFSLIRETGLLHLDYLGSNYSLYSRNEPNFPIFVTLLASPACWNAGMAGELEIEKNRATRLLHPQSLINVGLLTKCHLFCDKKHH